MKKTLATILALGMALLLGLGCFTSGIAEEEQAFPHAYIMYANSDWSISSMSDESTDKAKVTAAELTGAGSYTTEVEFETEANDISFSALKIDNGENVFPGYLIRIDAIRLNGEAIEFTKGYTSSDDGVETRMNIYNVWTNGEIPADARSWDGTLENVTSTIVDPEIFTNVKTIAVDFTLLEHGVDHAYIMYANNDWSVSNFGITDSEDGKVKVTAAEIKDFGDYTVGLEFAEEVKDLAFTALGIQYGEVTYPGAYLKINAIRVNGEAIEFTKGYTSSDNGVETRMNIYNAWTNGVIPEDARSWDGKTEDASAEIVDPALFTGVKSVEIDFSLIPVTDTAFLMYANSDWSISYTGGEPSEGVTVTSAEITGPGTYTVGLEFAQAAADMSFSAVGIQNGENTFNGYFIDILEIKVNGEPIETTKGYTSSDDGITTRENIFNEWTGGVLPSDARRADGNLEDATSMIVKKDAFTDVKTIEVTFDFIYGKPIEKSADAPLTEEEAAEMQKADYNAYIGVQTESYIFRNSWDEGNYGRDSETNPGFFTHLVGWDADNNAVDYGGVFEDALLTNEGEYSVSLTTGEMGFGADTYFRLLFVSTEIPSKLVKDGFVTIEDVRVKIGDAATQKYTDIDTSGDYVRIVVIDEYNRGEAPFGYTVPGADAKITITFTVKGLTE